MLDQEKPMFPPHFITQKLLNSNIIEFYENDFDDLEDDYRWIRYRVKYDYILLYLKEYMEYPSIITDILERYYRKDHENFDFEAFEVFVNEDILTDDISDFEKEITIFKKVNWEEVIDKNS